MRFQSNAAKGIEPIPYPGFAGQAIAKRYSFSAPNTLAAGDIIEIAPIPPGCRVVDVILDSDQLDTNAEATIALDVGVMSGEWGDNDSERTCGAEFFSGATTAQAGGLAHTALKSAVRVAPSDKARSIGVKVTTAGATKAAGEIGITAILAAG